MGSLSTTDLKVSFLQLELKTIHQQLTVLNQYHVSHVDSDNPHSGGLSVIGDIRHYSVKGWIGPSVRRFVVVIVVQWVIRHRGDVSDVGSDGRR